MRIVMNCEGVDRVKAKQSEKSWTPRSKNCCPYQTLAPTWYNVCRQLSRRRSVHHVTIAWKLTQSKQHTSHCFKSTNRRKNESDFIGTLMCGVNTLQLWGGGRQQKFKAAFVAFHCFKLAFKRLKSKSKKFHSGWSKVLSDGNKFLSKQTQKWSRNVLNFPNNGFLASSTSYSRWHSNWLCVDVLFISPTGKKGAGSKLKWLLWSINLHEKIIKGVGVGRRERNGN